MENATKALLIAGGVLIAIIIITMFLLMFNNLANIKKEQEDQTKLEQLTAFNNEFEAYNKKVMYGVDVITLINKATENNKKYADSEDYKIKVILDGKEITSSTDLVNDEDKKKSIYTCVQTKYNSLGRICEIEIELKHSSGGSN